MSGMGTLGAKAREVFESVVDRGIEGLPPFASSWELAVSYMADGAYADNDARVAALIARESRKNAFSTAVTNLGGLITLPVAVPVNAYASFAYQARLAAAVSLVYGHDIRSPRVRALVGVSLAGKRAVEALKSAGVKAMTMLLERGAAQLSERLAADLGTGVGMRILAQGGQQLPGLMLKSVPLAGAAVCGLIDWRYCRAVGRVSGAIFRGK